MPEVSDAIPGSLQSLSQWVLCRIHGCRLSGRMHTLLRLREAARFHPTELERGENLCGLEAGAGSWLWYTRGNRAGPAGGSVATKYDLCSVGKAIPPSCKLDYRDSLPRKSNLHLWRAAPYHAARFSRTIPVGATSYGAAYLQ